MNRMTQWVLSLFISTNSTLSRPQVIADGYAAHLNNLMDPGALRPATGNARMFLRKSCFRLPSNTESKKTAKRTVSYPGTAGKGAEFLRLPDTAPGPTKIIVPDVPIGEEDGFGGAARARGKSPTVQKNTGTRTTTVWEVDESGTSTSPTVKKNAGSWFEKWMKVGSQSCPWYRKTLVPEPRLFEKWRKVGSHIAHGA